MAHEFKTPLNSIISLIEKIKNYLEYDDENDLIHHEESNEPNINKDLNLISSLSNNTLFLISDIIQYSNQTSNKKDLEIIKQPVELKKIMNFNYDILKALISCNENKSKFITQNLKIEDSIKKICIKTDEYKFNQIMLNIISNAVKFTKTGGIVLRALIKNEEDNIQKNLIISIEDSGIGIKENKKNLIFGDSNNLDLNYNLNKMGSGLGLNISHEIAKKLNYKISFVSEENKGTKFFIEIPKEDILESRNFTENPVNSIMSEGKSKRSEKNSIFQDKKKDSYVKQSQELYRSVYSQKTTRLNSRLNWLYNEKNFNWSYSIYKINIYKSLDSSKFRTFNYEDSF